MNPWVVDSCVLLDVALRDPLHGRISAEGLEKRQNEGLTVCPVSVIEIAPFFGGELRNVRHFLNMLGAETDASWLEADTETAVSGWSRYVALKRQGRVPKRPVADILIGAFACRRRGLITRNPEHFRPFFQDLNLKGAEA